MKFTIYNPLKGTSLDHSSSYTDVDEPKPSTFLKNTKTDECALTQMADCWPEEHVEVEADASCLSRRC